MTASSSSEYALGIDLGGTGIKAGVVSAHGTLLREWKVPTELKGGDMWSPG
ncbi:MAG: ROK family protein [Candidatus Omnitrophica bacterium]|nr:ROK family protein [Candidatus Omnitrophota bacterium]